MVTLGQRIKNYRKALNWTQGDLADIIAMSVPYISDLEKGRTEPSLATLRKLARAFKVSVINLLANVEGYGESSGHWSSSLEAQVAYSEAVLDIRKRIEQLNQELESIHDKAETNEMS